MIIIIANFIVASDDLRKVYVPIRRLSRRDWGSALAKFALAVLGLVTVLLVSRAKEKDEGP